MMLGVFRWYKRLKCVPLTPIITLQCVEYMEPVGMSNRLQEFWVYTVRVCGSNRVREC